MPPLSLSSLALTNFDLEKIYQKFQDENAPGVQSDLFKGGRFNKPVDIVLSGRVDSAGIETKTFNDVSNHVIGIRLTGKGAEAVEGLMKNVKKRVDAANAEIDDVSDHWSVKAPLFQGVLEVKLKQKNGKFTAKMNKNFDLKNLAATFVEPEQKVTIKGNMRWWVSNSGIVGISFALNEIAF